MKIKARHFNEVAGQVCHFGNPSIHSWTGSFASLSYPKFACSIVLNICFDFYDKSIAIANLNLL